MIDVITGLAMLGLILAAGITLFAVLSRINDGVETHDEHEDGGI